MAKEVKENEMKNQEAEENKQNETPVAEEKEKKIDLKAFGGKVIAFGKKIAPVAAGMAVGVIGMALYSSLGQDKADEIIDNVTKALPDKREDKGEDIEIYRF